MPPGHFELIRAGTRHIIRLPLNEDYLAMWDPRGSQSRALHS